jgi:hypothetical protein
LFKDERMINAESQKTGIETNTPVKLMAKGDFLSPITDKRYFAMLAVPPDFSKNMPMIAPNPMIMPMLDKVFPKPSLILSRITTPSKPIKNPTIMAARIKVIKG